MYIDLFHFYEGNKISSISKAYLLYGGDFFIFTIYCEWMTSLRIKYGKIAVYRDFNSLSIEGVKRQI